MIRVPQCLTRNRKASLTLKFRYIMSKGREEGRDVAGDLNACSARLYSRLLDDHKIAPCSVWLMFPLPCLPSG